VDVEAAYKEKAAMRAPAVSNAKLVPGRIAVLRKMQDLVIDLIDFSAVSEKNEGFCYLLSVIEGLTSYAWLFPLKTKESSTVGSLIANLVLEIGVPQRFRCDNGGEFVIIKSLAAMFGAECVNGRAYHPQTQGKVERYNGIIETLINDFWNSIPRYRGNWIDCCKS
jgi:IS30 family transposase